MSERKHFTPPLPTTSEGLYAEFEKQIHRPPEDPFEKVKNSFLLVSSDRNPLAEEVGDLLGKKVHRSIRGSFANGEYNVHIPESVRGLDVFIIEQGGPNPNGRIMATALTAATARDSGARSVTAIIPSYPYARQDRITESRTPNSVQVVTDILTVNGVTRTLTVDIHSEQSRRRHWDNIYAKPPLIEALKKRKQSRKYAGPDVGSGKRTEAFADWDEAADDEIALVYKSRLHQGANESIALDLMGDVRDQNVVIVDDLLDTAGTAINGAEIILEHGAKSVSMVATHADLSEKDGISAVGRIENSPLEFVIVTNTILQKQRTLEELEQSSKIEVISISPMIARAILVYQTGESMGARLINKPSA